MGKNIKMENGPTRRKRGRPAGKNRVPLSEAERKARNAQYERERRAENAEAMAELAEAIGVSVSKVQPCELLDAVINFISQVRESTDSLKSINKKLKMQIRKLEQTLSPNPVKQETSTILPTAALPLPTVATSSVPAYFPDPAPVSDVATSRLPVYFPEPSPVPDVDVPLASMNYTDALTSGYGDAQMYWTPDSVMFEASPSPEQSSPTEGLVLDYDFLLDYLETNT